MVVAVGFFGEPIDYLRDLLSRLAAVQTWLGVANEVDAAALIFRHQASLATIDQRYIIVDWSVSYTFVNQSITRGAAWLPVGDMLMYFSEPANPALSRDDNMISAGNNLSAMLTELSQAAGVPASTPGKKVVNITGLSLEDFNRPDQEDADGFDIIESFWTVAWRYPRGR